MSPVRVTWARTVAPLAKSRSTAFALAVFMFDLYFSIAGSIDINNQFAELAARGASGHEYLGVGSDILAMGVIFISVVGFVLSVISGVFAQYKSIRILSVTLCPLFFLPIFISAFILTL